MFILFWVLFCAVSWNILFSFRELFLFFFLIVAAILSKIKMIRSYRGVCCFVCLSVWSTLILNARHGHETCPVLPYLFDYFIPRCPLEQQPYGVSCFNSGRSRSSFVWIFAFFFFLPNFLVAFSFHTNVCQLPVNRLTRPRHFFLFFSTLKTLGEREKKKLEGFPRAKEKKEDCRHRWKRTIWGEKKKRGSTLVSFCHIDYMCINVACWVCKAKQCFKGVELTWKKEKKVLRKTERVRIDT